MKIPPQTSLPSLARSKPDRLPADATVAELRENPWGFDFFRALRLIESGHPGRPRIGEAISPREEQVRFGQKPHLSFATSTLQGIEDGDGGIPPRLDVHCFGLFGPNGPLPIHLTEYARERRHNFRDTTLSGFLDLFQHRLISLFYRAWAVNQKSVDFDRPEESRFADYIGSFFGTGEPSLRGRDDIDDHAKLYYSGRLAAQTRNVEGLEAILADFFQVPANIETFVGSWLPVPAVYHCRLGISPDSATLGENVLVGERTWDVQNRFRVRLGPVGFARFQDFLPVGRSFRRLTDWIEFYTAHQFHWDVELVLKAAEVPATQLGAGSLLGWTSWLRTDPMAHAAADLVIDRTESRTERKHHLP